jgi:transcriptional regulator with XRE-family HTH domain
MPVSPGQYLKAVREGLQLEMREVQDASMVIASEEGKEDFYVSPARLTQIENDESIPSFYKLFSLCQIYGLDFIEVLAGMEFQGSREVEQIEGVCTQRSKLPLAKGEMQCALVCSCGFYNDCGMSGGDQLREAKAI